MDTAKALFEKYYSLFTLGNSNSHHHPSLMYLVPYGRRQCKLLFEANIIEISQVLAELQPLEDSEFSARFLKMRSRGHSHGTLRDFLSGN